MGRAIFISYRRDDSEGEAGRLFDDLVRAFDADTVFMDVDGITPGVDFRKAIDENVAGCGVLLAMIGPRWTTIADDSGERRLDNANDFVRLEIATALQRNIAVIPVLVHEAHMPHADQLPENLQDLAYRNSVELTHARWNSDVQLLIHALQRYVAPGSAEDKQTVHATVPVQLPAPSPAAPQVSSSPKRISVLGMGVVMAAVLGLGVVAWRAYRGTADHAADAGRGNANTASQPAQQGSQAPAQTAVPASAPPAAAVSNPRPVASSAFSGTWVNPTPVAQNGLLRLEIAEAGRNNYTVHGWGKCQPEDCDWAVRAGAVQASGPDQGKLLSTFLLKTKPGIRYPDRSVIVKMQRAGDRLEVLTINNMPAQSNIEHQFEFVRQR